MACLPDDVWAHVLEIGVKSSRSLSYRDLCCVSICCRRLHRLSNEDSLWSHLLFSDFSITYPPNTCSSTSPSPYKSIYRLSLEADIIKKKAAHKRAVLRKESQIAENLRRLEAIEASMARETERLKAADTELSNLHRIRHASVALRVWQPEVVRGKQKQIVEQCAVPVESRIGAVGGEVRLCRLQIATLNKSYEDEKKRLQQAKRELESIKYRPLSDYGSASSTSSGPSVKRRRMMSKGHHVDWFS